VRCWCNGIAEIQLKGRCGATRPVLIREGQTSSVTFE
jgi:hypothetical protein